MTAYQLKDLLQRHIDGTLSDSELVTLRSALLKFEDDAEVAKILDSVWDGDAGVDVSKEKAEIIFQSITSIRKSKNKNLRWLSVAASIAVIISIAVAIKFTGTLPSEKIKTQQNTAQVKISPGQNKAVLTLSNGKTISLDEQGNGELATDAGVVVSKLSDGQLSYTTNNSQANAALQFNTISTPRGGQYMIILPDGTKVWLNAHSSLRYPVQFASKERVVEVVGEAYFEVAKNKLKPFKVLANNVEVKVLGTHFNVTAYADEASIKTTLLEGSVNVNNTILKPGQQAQVNNQNHQINVSSVKIDEVVAWKNGLFIFRNEDIQSIMKKVSRWYDVEVEFKDKKILDQKFGGTFSRSGELSDMLESMSLTGVIHFKTDGRRITVIN